MTNTDLDWEVIGRKWPYYGVCTDERFRQGATQEFFDSGETLIRHIAEKANLLYGSFSPRRTLDFGCGVGRLTIPLAKRSHSIVAADVSLSMLEEAKRNCHRFGITNATFTNSDDSLPIAGQFDFINSFIVFQHIPVKRGYAIFDKILRHLTKGGVGTVHFTLKDERPRYKRMFSLVRQHLSPLQLPINILRGRPIGEPPMQMNDYNVCTLLSILEKNECRDVSLEPISYAGRFAAIVFFRKTSPLPSAIS